MSYTLFIKCSLYTSQEGAKRGLHGGNYPYILQNKILAKHACVARLVHFALQNAPIRKFLLTFC